MSNKVVSVKNNNDRFWSITAEPIIIDENHRQVTKFFKTELACNVACIEFLNNGYRVIKLFHTFEPEQSFPELDKV